MIQTHHEALREVVVGRGRGKHTVVVADFALIGSGKVLHIIRQDGRSVCGRSGELDERIEVDARAVRVGGYPVCTECQRLVGRVEPPKRLIDE